MLVCPFIPQISLPPVRFPKMMAKITSALGMSESGSSQLPLPTVGAYLAASLMNVGVEELFVVPGGE